MVQLWFRMDNAFTENEKFLNAGPAAGYLYIAALAWASRNLTDGFIPRTQPQRLVLWEGYALQTGVGELTDNWHEVNADMLIDRLIEVGLWDVVESGYQIHDYLEWQRSAEEIKALSKQRSEAGKRGGKAKHKQNRSKTQANAKQNASKIEADTDTDTELKNTYVELKHDDDVKKLFDYWRDQCGHPNAKLTADRRTKIKARLRDGYSEADIRTAINGAAQAAYVDENGKRFDDLELICRNGSKLEDFINRADQNGARQQTTAEWVAAFNTKKRAE